MSHVPVAWYCEPFMRRPHSTTMRAGMTLEEIVRSIPREDLPANFLQDGVATINGEVIPRELWARVRPRCDGPVPVVVNLYPVVQGGGGGGSKKNPWAVVAAIVTLAATIWIGGGGLTALGFSQATFGAGTFGALAASTVVSVAGSMLVNSLTPPPQLSRNSGDNANGREPASLSGNVLQPDGPIPTVIGQYQISPPFGAMPLVDLDGDDEVLEAVMVLAGPHRWDQIRIDDTDIDEMAEVVDYETREGWASDAALSLITRYGRTEQANIRLSEHKLNPNNGEELEDQSTPDNSLPQPHIITAGDPSMSEIWLTFSWPAGLINTANQGIQTIVPVRISVRARGDTTWIDLPEIHFGYNKSQPVMKMAKLIWDKTAPAQPTPSTARAPIRVLNSIPAQNVSPLGSVKTFHSRFGTPSGTQSLNVYRAATAGANTITNVAMYEDRVEFYMGTGGDANLIPKGILEIKIQRGFAFLDNNYSPTTCAFNGSLIDFFGYRLNATYRVEQAQTTMQSLTLLGRHATVYNDNPVPVWPIEGQGLAALALKIRSRNFNKISCLVSKYVQDWNGSSWGTWTADSRNPAPHFVAVIAGPLNLDPVPAALLDNDTLTAWRQRCTDNARTADGVVDGQAVASVSAMIASAGYASPRQSETWGVAEDRDRSADDIRQLFSPRNSSNFRWSDPLVKLPDAIRATYRDSSLDYIEQQIVVPRPYLAEISVQLPSTIDYVMITEEDKIRERAQFDMRQMLLRTRMYSLETDLEALCCTRGDLVGVQHDIIRRWAGYALIKEVMRDASGFIPGLVLDAEVPTSLLSGATMGVQIRLSDQSMLVKQLVPGVEERSNILMFTSPFADPGTLLPECLVVTGELGSEYRRLLVHAVVPNELPRISVMLKDEAPELFTAYPEGLSAIHKGNFNTVQPGSLASERLITGIPIGSAHETRRVVLVVCSTGGVPEDNVLYVRDAAGNQLDLVSDAFTVRTQLGSLGEITIMDRLIPAGTQIDIQFNTVSSYYALAAYVLVGGAGGVGDTVTAAGASISQPMTIPAGAALIAGAGTISTFPPNPVWGADLTDNGRDSVGGSIPSASVVAASRVVEQETDVDVELTTSSGTLNMAAVVYT